MGETVRRLAFATRDADEARAVLSQVYAGHRMRLHGTGTGFEYRQEAAIAEPLAVGRFMLLCEVDLYVEPLAGLLFMAVVGGRAEARTPSEQRLVTGGDVLLNPLGTPVRSLCRQLDARTLTLHPSVVAEHAAATVGIDAADFRFEGTAPRSAAMGRYWRDTMIYLTRLFDGVDCAAREPLVRRAAAELAAAAAVTAFPNTATAPGAGHGPGLVAPAAVRRAVAYIDANAGDPITAQRIATAAGLSPRAMQAAFQRHLGTTPMAYLRRVRLERAHRELLAADPTRGDTVRAVALRWGFINQGRFATAYRRAFGRPPNRTLRA